MKHWGQRVYEAMTADQQDDPPWEDLPRPKRIELCRILGAGDVKLCIAGTHRRRRRAKARAEAAA